MISCVFSTNFRFPINSFILLPSQLFPTTSKIYLLRLLNSLKMRLFLTLLAFITIYVSACDKDHSKDQNTSLTTAVRPYQFGPTGTPGSLCSFWKKCPSNLKCVLWGSGLGLGVCKRPVPPGYPCDSLYTCSDGAECINKRCFIKLPVGGNCRDVRITKCQYGSQCVNNICIRDGWYGAKCDGKYLACRKGLICAKGHCRIHLKKGSRCGSSGSVCQTGTSCVRYHGELRCIGVMQYGGKCEGTFITCDKGMWCIGPIGKRKCVVKKGKGYACDSPYRVCKPELSCLKWSGILRCIGSMGVAGSCEQTFMACQSGLQCVGPKGHRQCHPVSEKGQKCDLKYKLCSKGLTCLDGKCVGLMSIGGDCAGEFMGCTQGLNCIKYKGYKVCMKKVVYLLQK